MVRRDDKVLFIYLCIFIYFCGGISLAKEIILFFPELKSTPA